MPGLLETLGLWPLAALAEARQKREAAAREAEDRKQYEAGLKAIQPDITKAEQADTAEQHALEKLQQAFKREHAQMLGLAAKKAWSQALARQNAVQQAAKALTGAVGRYQACTTLLEGPAGKADSDYLFLLNYTTPPSPQTKDALKKYQDLMRLYHGGDYDGCMAAFKDLQKGMKALKQAVADADKVAKPKAEAAVKSVQKLAGDKPVASLNAKGQAKLVDSLKALPLSKQTDLLADLHGPSGQLDAEGRAIQRAMYKAMTLDPKFKQADQKKREAYRDELKQDTGIQDAVADWNAKDDKGQPKVSAEAQQKVFEKVLAVQCKVYKIPVPAIRWYQGASGDFGGFNTTSGIISLNTRYLSDPEEMINTILHENTHNYQDQLVKRFFAGELKPDSEEYEQAKAFALTHHMDAYVSSDEDAAVYKVQPEEMHAWDAGDQEAPALMKQLQQARQARQGAKGSP